MLAFLDYYRPIDVDLFKTCYPWSVLDLHVEEIHVLPVSQFLLFMIPMLLKKYVAVRELTERQTHT